MDLFDHALKAQIERESPLAHRMRPRTLDEFVGQDHIVGPGRLLRRAIQADQLSSIIFWGPPGTGKTTLAMVIAGTTATHFITINAVLSGVPQIRAAVDEAQDRRRRSGQRTTLFVDEVHRWNKAQQDALLPHVEKGSIILIGATTENPFFEVNKALVSRSRIFQLRPLGPDDLRRVVAQALADRDRGFGGRQVTILPEALEHLVDVGSGDARSVLNALELAVETTPPDADGRVVIDLGVAEESIQRRAVLYDKEGDVHYDTISAFIKSLRGSDPDAALYWMARMIYAGEDPHFVFRRMAILAGEDVGLADPNAVRVVESCWALFDRIGMPEGRFHLAEAALYLATCPKSNTTLAFFDALSSVEAEGDADVPNPLRDASRDKEGFGHGEGYLYPHAYRDHWVAQQYLPEALQGRVFYEPSDQGHERGIAEQVAQRREAQVAAMVEAAEGLPEVLTTGPVDRSREAWLQRAVASAGRSLGHLREAVFEAAAVARHHLVLDLQAGTGLLSWEAVRRAPDGGVWALAADAASARALRQMAERLPEVERPVVLQGRPDEVDALLDVRGEAEVRFDRILGRNPFIAVVTAARAEPEPLRPRGRRRAAPVSPVRARLTDLARSLRQRLLPGGRLVVAQVVPCHGQRLHRLIDWAGEDATVQAEVAAAEEAIYGDPDDPLVAWDETDLEAAFAAAGFGEVRVRLERLGEKRPCTPAQLDRWFGVADPARRDRPRYVDRLAAAGLDADACLRIAARYRRQLSGAEVAWETAVAHLVALV